MCSRNKFEVSYDSVRNLRYDVGEGKRIPTTKPKIGKVWPLARFMCVTEEADLTTCTYTIAQMMQQPFQMFPIATIAVHSSVRDEFVERLRSRFRQLDPDVAFHPSYEKSLKIIEAAGLKYIKADKANAPPFASPVLVENTTQKAFGTTNSGVVTLHTFDTIKQAADVFLNELPPFVAVHLFDQGVGSVYTLAERIHCKQFYVNTMEVSLLPIIEYYAMKKSHAMISNGYHYETILVDDKWRIIVFPCTSALPTVCCCQAGRCHCLTSIMNCCD